MKQFLDIELNDNPTQWERLCNLVRRVSPEAADWMQKNSNVPPYNGSVGVHYSLVDAFVWLATPQGHQYWENLEVQLLTMCPDKYPVYFGE